VRIQQKARFFIEADQRNIKGRLFDQILLHGRAGELSIAKNLILVSVQRRHLEHRPAA